MKYRGQAQFFYFCNIPARKTEAQSKGSNSSEPEKKPFKLCMTFNYAYLEVTGMKWVKVQNRIN